MDWLICIFVLSAKYMSAKKNILAWPLFILAGIATIVLGVREELWGILSLAVCDIFLCIWGWRKWHEK